MSRVRLTSRTAFDASKVAKEEKVEDAYSQNNPDHAKNDPKEDQYVIGTPSDFAEDVNKDNLWKDDDRVGTGHSKLVDKKAAAEAIASAREMEMKAVKCIIASQRMLPGAPDELIEKQASVLLSLPGEGIDEILSNQQNFAKMISKAASEIAEEVEEDKEDKEDKEV